MAEMTLDFAQAAFEVAPSHKTAADLLATASEYWWDGIIGDETYNSKVVAVEGWLRQWGDA